MDAQPVTWFSPRRPVEGGTANVRPEDPERMVLSWDEKGNCTLRPATLTDTDLPQGEADYSDGDVTVYLPPGFPLGEEPPRNPSNL